jgi:hypothetical protein
MKKLLIILVVLSFGSQLLAQISSSYAFATGTTAGVSIMWDAYSDQITIEGCYLYKKITYTHEYELLHNELLVSEDSTYSFTDQGAFDPDYPPIYAIHVQTADSVYVIEEIYAFQMIEFDVPGDEIVSMQLKGWSSSQCCQSVKLWIDDIFMGDFTYDDTFVYNFNLEGITDPSFDVYLIFEGYDGLYAEFSLTGTHLFWILNTVGNPELEETHKQFSLFPNPASNAVWLKLPERISLVETQIELYSPSGMLLYKEKPSSHFHKIDVAHLPKGTYLVRLWDGAIGYVEKLVVR